MPTAPALIIIPTYNELENLPELVKAIFAVAADVHLLVVDDGSPDGTGALADELAAADPRVHVLHRAGKLGLGTAYIAGFKWALERDYPLVFEMDADFSHQPRYIPEFIAAAADADVVLGCRYIKGGGTEDWGLWRKFVSRGGNLYARMVLWLPFHDLTGGFKCFRREVLEALDLDGVKSTGYAFQIELTYRAHKLGFRVAEVPIIFPDRQVGQSKMSGSIVREAVVNLVKLRFDKSIRKSKRG
ncbi:MAG: dolichyl-phosphate beta-D-mannosyltransferase [Deltaproteobacteria bacterium HGW-Deltaproteobacteria-14]|jgi:dolichol-phosphate mannosyltransferase|nr:MAG: dolichyl-phosphate beta-D-mannosyltransferase [Deltaproteobacteria bacterium HGW-Deltaproteobacteria-14]